MDRDFKCLICGYESDDEIDFMASPSIDELCCNDCYKEENCSLNVQEKKSIQCHKCSRIHNLKFCPKCGNHNTQFVHNTSQEDKNAKTD